ncbi:MAG TPA: Ig-like domain-containing protein, partial [Kineosporiaceae bacterium]|nr:Ig-like domain-containing protein [Kineosporiaceae bacterium]
PAPGRSAGRAPRRVPLLGWSAIGAAAALAAVLIVLRGLPGTPSVGVEQVAAQVDAGVLGPNSADPSDALTLRFSRPLDRTTVNSALRLSPAAAYTPSWNGDTLTITPAHGFAPNAAYVLTIDHHVARTASGEGLASDVRVVFGTAPAIQAGPARQAPQNLGRTVLAPAEDGSEAVVTRNGSVLLTAAQAGHGGTDVSGLVRMSGDTATRLSAATPAICVSRSGRSVAFLSRSSAGSQIVLADATGALQSQISVDADPAGPIGWIDDDAVTFVAGGRLRAVDRSGHVTTLSDQPVDPRHDTVVVAPGGRYVYLAHGTDPGVVLDLHTQQTHPLTQTAGPPSFSPDGSTVAWAERHGNTLHLDTAPAGGGPTLSVPLDLKAGDTVSDLSLSPDASMLTYSVTHADRSGVLRLAALPSAVTIAESSAGTGESPNWAPTGRMFTVLAHGSSGPQIQAVEVPSMLQTPSSATQAITQAFANAQISGDAGAQQALAAPGVSLPAIARISRATVLWVDQREPGTATAQVRLGMDPTTADPVSHQAEETLTLRTTDGGIPRITAVDLRPFAPAAPGPELTRVDTTTVVGAVLLAFDSDLDPRTIPAGLALFAHGGSQIPATVAYDAGTRTVTLQPVMPGGAGTGPVDVVITTALRDVSHTPAAGARTVTVQPGPVGP